ncbi:ParB N-terminal domain-containing protein [Microbacterium paraoxydans]|uniref:ParB N-terminal domain-containing protein n=1 Tax=Microbacterium paraoxydans TaxID=199592 RepID=UPI0021A54F7A|nr:ParB N-terminal domain-containing protein [Microbacterium paraoxydans]MCT2222996.1 ParB N-terminal domain-containing protein [Microbacterium paraoxydans]
MQHFLRPLARLLTAAAGPAPGYGQLDHIRRVLDTLRESLGLADAILGAVLEPSHKSLLNAVASLLYVVAELAVEHALEALAAAPLVRAVDARSNSGVRGQTGVPLYFGVMRASVPTLPLHDLALLLPEIPAEEFEALSRSIAENGQYVPATSWVAADGIEYLIDGRHRARACERLGIPLVVEKLAGDEAAARAFVLANNVTRRHLSTSQRAAVAATLATRTTGQTGKAADLGMTQDAAARAAGVSVRLVRAARTFLADAELTREVLDGNLSVTEASRRARRDRAGVTAARLETLRTSATDEWLTPAWLIRRVESVLGHIDGDVAAEPGRTVPARWHLTAEDDALSVASWANPPTASTPGPTDVANDGDSPSRLWMNPPWAKASHFVRRLLREVDAGRVERAVVLLPARLGAEYVANLTERGYPRVELTGRLRFEPGRGAAPTARGEAPFASMLIGVGIDADAMHAAFHDVGVIVQAVRPRRGEGIAGG